MHFLRPVPCRQVAVGRRVFLGLAARRPRHRLGARAQAIIGDVAGSGLAVCCRRRPLRIYSITGIPAIAPTAYRLR